MLYPYRYSCYHNLISNVRAVSGRPKQVSPLAALRETKKETPLS